MIIIDGEHLPWSEGMTVADLLKEMQNTRHYAVVRVNDIYVSKPNFETFVIPDQAKIFLIPMIAGG